MNFFKNSSRKFQVFYLKLSFQIHVLLLESAPIHGDEKKLEGIKNTLLGKADIEPDKFKRIAYDKLAQYPLVMRELYKNIEMLVTAHLALQFKLEGLRDNIYELDEVKKEP